MDTIQRHFEQMALSAQAIAELPFPKPKIFTNALLQPHDITALIRDTEVHERALFTAAAAESSNTRKSLAPGVSAGENALSSLKPGTAVGRILGSELQRRIRRSERAKGEVDVDLLLEGAEKLCAAYPMAGVLERIHALRSRHEKLADSVAIYEEKLAEQAAEFEQLSLQQQRGNWDDTDDYRPVAAARLTSAADNVAGLADEEEAELQELEQRKKGLEDRVIGLDRDLGGLRG